MTAEFCILNSWHPAAWCGELHFGKGMFRRSRLLKPKLSLTFRRLEPCMGKCGPTIANPPNRSQDELTTSASATRLKKGRRKMKKALLITLFFLFSILLASWAFAWIAPIAPSVSEPLVMLLVGACLIALKHLMPKVWRWRGILFLCSNNNPFEAVFATFGTWS